MNLPLKLLRQKATEFCSTPSGLSEISGQMIQLFE